MKIIKYIKSLFNKDYVLNHYEEFIFNTLINNTNIEFSNIIKSQLNHMKFIINSFHYNRYIRNGFTNFYYKHDLSNILLFDTIRKDELLAKIIITDSNNIDYEIFVFIDEHGLIEKFTYYSFKEKIKNKYIPKKDSYSLKSFVFFEY